MNEGTLLRESTTVIPAPPDLTVWIVWRWDVYDEQNRVIRGKHEYELQGPHRVLAIATTVTGYSVSPAVEQRTDEKGRRFLGLVNVPDSLYAERHPKAETSSWGTGPHVAFLTDCAFDGMATSWASTDDVRFSEEAGKELIKYHEDPGAQSNAQSPPDTPEEGA